METSAQNTQPRGKEALPIDTSSLKSSLFYPKPSPIKIKLQKLAHFKGPLPRYESLGAACFDIRACLSSPVELARGERALIPTGLAFEIPEGFELQCRPRSGLALKQGLTVLNSPGTIDSDYRGEIKILILNTGAKAVQIKDQARLAQMALQPVFKAEFEECDTLSPTQRASGGFGSTGL